MSEIIEAEVETFEEFNLVVRDGLMLQGYEWTVENPKAAICLVHGLGEHAQRYDHVARFFNENGVSFYNFDLRGHGLSEGKRGHTPSMERSIDDIEEVLMYVRSEHNELPIFLYGHSLGGNFVANYILTKNTTELSGAIISSPWLKVKKPPSSTEIKLAKTVNKIFPSLTQSNRLDTNDITSIAEVNEKYAADKLVHDRISVRLFLECYYGGEWALQNVDRLKLSILVFHGADDNITDPEASKLFADRAADLATFELFENTKHEPHNDQNQNLVFENTLEWINRNC